VRTPTWKRSRLRLPDRSLGGGCPSPVHDRVAGPVNVTRMPELSSLDEVVALGVVRVSWAIFLFEQAMRGFAARLASLD